MKTFDDHWTNIEEYFEWDKVHKVMVALNWTWKSGVPSIQELKTSAKRLLKEAYDSACETNETTRIGTGGFEAECHIWDSKPTFSLDFILDSWETHEMFEEYELENIAAKRAEHVDRKLDTEL